jgi:hypothetical protein
VSSILLVELAGLPGVGKSTATQSLLAQLGPERAARIGTWRSRLRSLRIKWLFLPYAVVRYRLPLSYLLAENAEVEPPKGTVAVARRVWDVVRRGRRDRDGAAFARLSFLLAFSTGTLEYWLARLEAALRGRPVVVDEGLVQLGTALWLGVLPEYRERFWQSWIAALPGRSLCLLLDVEPETALARATGRSSGLPWLLATAETLHGDTLAAGAVYGDTYSLLCGDTLRQGVDCQSVRGTASAEAVANEVARTLELAAPGFLIAARPPNR